VWFLEPTGPRGRYYIPCRPGLRVSSIREDTRGRDYPVPTRCTCVFLEPLKEKNHERE